MTSAFRTSSSGRLEARRGFLFGHASKPESVHGSTWQGWSAGGRDELGTGQDQQLLHGPCRERAPLGTAGLEAGPSHQVSRQSALHLLGGGRQAWSIVELGMVDSISTKPSTDRTTVTGVCSRTMTSVPRQTSQGLQRHHPAFELAPAAASFLSVSQTVLYLIDSLMPSSTT